MLHSHFELLACDHVQLDKSWRYDNVTSTFYRLLYIEEGRGRLYNSEFSLSLEPGFIYLIPSFTNCNYGCDTYLGQYFICFVEASADGSSMFSGNRKVFKMAATEEDIAAIKKLLLLNPERGLTLSYNPKVYEKSKVLSRYIDQNKRLPLHQYVATCSILLQLISRFLAAPEFLAANATPINAIISDALYFIQTNLHAEITVALLAKRANKSPDHFSRLFTESTGELPLTYVQIKRIERARLLLSTSNLPFSKIAAAAGFESPSYFARIFKKVTGQTPGGYKSGNPVL